MRVQVYNDYPPADIVIFIGPNQEIWLCKEEAQELLKQLTEKLANI